MARWEFLIVDVAVDANHTGNFEVDVEPDFAPLTVRGSDELRDALSRHAHYEVVFARRLEA